MLVIHGYKCITINNAQKSKKKNEGIIVKMIRYKINILQELKNKGYNTTKIRKCKILSEGTLTNIRQNKYISMHALNTICKLLECQPSDLIEYVEDVEQQETK